MTSAQRNDALAILLRCKTLEDADHMLVKIRPEISKAMRWALFDGFSGRPPTMSGLCDEKHPNPEVSKTYQEGVCIGRELSMRNLPA